MLMLLGSAGNCWNDVEPPATTNVSPPSIELVVEPSLTVQLVLIAAVPAAVSLPCASTVNVGCCCITIGPAVGAVSSKVIVAV